MTGIFEPIDGAVAAVPAIRVTQRSRQALSSKKKLYRTALKLFAQKGYDAVSVDEICAKAGLTKGAFYSHFRSKHDIIVIQLGFVDEAHAKAFAELPTDVPTREKIETFTAAIAAKFEEVGDGVQRSLYLAEMSPRTAIRFTLNEERPVYVGLGMLAAEGQERGEFRRDLAATRIRDDLVRCIRGALLEWTLSQGGINLSDAVKSLVIVYLDGVTAGAH